MYNLEDSNIHSDIFELFISMKPEVVYTMKSCDHGINLHLPNPYHMEGDVWTHTCLSYNALLSIPEYYKLNSFQKSLACLAILCHDIGKPFSRKINEVNYCTFYNHESRSVIETISIVDFLNENYHLTAQLFYWLLLIINLHSEYWKENCDLNKIYADLDYNDILLDVYKVITRADSLGQITSSSIGLKSNIFDLTFEKPDNIIEFDDTKPTVYLMIGSPASGKDTIASNLLENVSIVSYDKLRVELYKQSFINENKLKDLSPNELYNNAWKWCNDKRIQLNDPMYGEIKDLLASGRNVAISNTNMTNKSRKPHIERLRKEYGYTINIVACFVCVDIIDLWERDENRKDEDKSVGEKVITKMYYSFELPTFSEGYDNIILYLNGTN
jgi:predicted kinase